jgi:hypothetical protein
LDRLNEEFINYQLLSGEDMPPSLKCEENHYRVDYLWGYLRGVMEPGTNVLSFGQLFRVAEVIMTPMLERSVFFLWQKFSAAKWYFVITDCY